MTWEKKYCMSHLIRDSFLIYSNTPNEPCFKMEVSKNGYTNCSVACHCSSFQIKNQQESYKNKKYKLRKEKKH